MSLLLSFRNNELIHQLHAAVTVYLSLCKIFWFYSDIVSIQTFKYNAIFNEKYIVITGFLNIYQLTAI
jgi:hypothetical protein